MLNGKKEKCTLKKKLKNLIEFDTDDKDGPKNKDSAQLNASKDDASNSDLNFNLICSDNTAHLKTKNHQLLMLTNPLGNKTKFMTDEDFDVDISTKKNYFFSSESLSKNNTRVDQVEYCFGDIRNLVLENLECHLLLLVGKESQDNCNELSGAKNILCKEEQSFLETKKKDSNLVIDTDNLISRLPYKKMLMDMFGGNLKCNVTLPKIPYITRAYEEAFMHEPTNSTERECAKGKNCECMFIDKKQPFIGVEFLLPGERPPKTPNMCVLCYRATTQQLYYDVIFDKCEFPGCIQKFGNIHSEQGEYLLESMLISTPTAPPHIMPLPIVSHQRNRYTVTVVSGIKRLKQSKVYFQNTPSCFQDIGM